MNSSYVFDTINMGWSIVYIKESPQGLKNPLVRSYLRESQAAGQVKNLWSFPMQSATFPMTANNYYDTGQVSIVR